MCAWFSVLAFVAVTSSIGLLDLVGSRARDETLDSSSVEFGKEEERISPPSSTYKGSRNQIKDTTTVLFTLRRYMFSTKKGKCHSSPCTTVFYGPYTIVIHDICLGIMYTHNFYGNACNLMQK